MANKIFIVGGLPESLTNFRGDLIQSLIGEGNEVVAMAGNASREKIYSIESLGAKYIPFPIQRNGLNPKVDISTLISLYKTFIVEKPDVIISYTIKPVVWGGIAARLYGKAKFYGLITGLGFAFQKGGLKRNLIGGLAKFLYKVGLAKASGVIFQNPDNQQVFIDEGIVSKDNTYRVNGSGVNVSRYDVSAFPESSPVFLTIARLLGEKGLREYAKAASIVKKKYPDATFQTVGPEDPSPDGIPAEEVKSWQESGAIEYLGGTDDVRPFIANCHVFVLASYHEGMPRTVLESMSMGRPILTTNVEGCRETVEPGVNGWLVPKQDAESLAERMIWFIENQQRLQEMGNASRKIVEEKFDVHKVNDELLRILGLKG